MFLIAKKVAALWLFVTCATSANAAPLPKDFLGNWCLSSSIVNGYDNLNKEYVPRTNIYGRDSCADKDDIIIVRHNGLFHPHIGECRVVKSVARRYSHSPTVVTNTYRCPKGDKLIADMWLENEALFVEYQYRWPEVE
jgi:hypothetical protein